MLATCLRKLMLPLLPATLLLHQVLASQVADRAAKEQHEKQEELEYAAHEQVRRHVGAYSSMGGCRVQCSRQQREA
jgi:hypothetical protein